MTLEEKLFLAGHFSGAFILTALLTRITNKVFSKFSSPKKTAVISFLFFSAILLVPCIHVARTHFIVMDWLACCPAGCVESV